MLARTTEILHSKIAPAAAGGSSPAAPALPLGQDLLETLAARFGPSGLMLALFRPDGSVAFTDPDAAEFFGRFAVPAMQLPHPPG